MIGSMIPDSVRIHWIPLARPMTSAGVRPSFAPAQIAFTRSFGAILFRRPAAIAANRKHAERSFIDHPNFATPAMAATNTTRKSRSAMLCPPVSGVFISSE